MYRQLSISVLSTAAILSGVDAWNMDKIAYVFNFSRHGARAPTDEFDHSLFSEAIKDFAVAPEMLTPMGMRQRYLTGCRNRKRYVEDYELLSPNYVPGEIYSQSSFSMRSMQSGYCEFMGLYPPGEGGAEELPEGLVNDLGPANPPFNVRDSKKVAEELGPNPLPHGFTQIQVMSYNWGNINDFRTESCPYV